MNMARQGSTTLLHVACRPPYPIHAHWHVVSRSAWPGHCTNCLACLAPRSPRCGDTRHPSALQPAKLFEKLSMPSVGAERQAESGMFIVDRQRHWLAVELALWLNVNDYITHAACKWRTRSQTGPLACCWCRCWKLGHAAAVAVRGPNGVIEFSCLPVADGDKDTFRAAFFLSGAMPAYYQMFPWP